MFSVLLFLLINFLNLSIKIENIALGALIVVYFLYLSLKIYRLKQEKMLLFFILALFLYLYSSFFFNIGHDQAVEGTFFLRKFFNQEIVNKIYKILYFNLVGINISLLVPIKMIKAKIFFKEKENKIIYQIYIILSFFYLNILSYQIYRVLTQGRMYLYTRDINIPMKIIEFLFYMFMILVISSNYSLKKNIKILKIVLLFSILEIFLGARAGFANKIFLLLWFYNEKIKKISINIILVCSILLLLIFSITSYFREGGSLNIINLIKAQGGTIGIIGHYLENKEELDKMHKIPYIFSFLVSGFQSIYGVIFGKIINYNSQEAVNIITSSGQQLSYVVNKDLFFRGFGIGSSYLIEMYDFCQELGIVFFSFLQSYIIRFGELNYKFLSKKVKIFFVMFFLEYLFIPRGGYLGISILRYLVILLIYFFFIFICCLVKKQEFVE